MKAVTVRPGFAGSDELRDVPEPSPDQGSVLVQGLSLGVCGTDREIVDGVYGSAPAGQEHLILGHESLGRVLDAPLQSGLAPGDLVVGIVRRPDPVPCPNCAVGGWDMCRNGRYTEHGIKGTARVLLRAVASARRPTSWSSAPESGSSSWMPCNATRPARSCA